MSSTPIEAIMLFAKRLLKKLFKVLKWMTKIIDAWDLVTPTTHHSEQKYSVQGFVEKKPEVAIVYSYDFSEDLHIPSTHIENQTMLNELPDKEYRQLVFSLNK